MKLDELQPGQRFKRSRDSVLGDEYEYITGNGEHNARHTETGELFVFSPRTVVIVAPYNCRPLTSTEKARQRTDDLNKIASDSGWETWRKFETAVLGGIDIPKRNCKV